MVPRASPQASGGPRHRRARARDRRAVQRGLDDSQPHARCSTSNGRRPANVLTMQLSLPQEDTFGAARAATFCRSRARASKHCRACVIASAISHLPLDGGNARRGFVIEGRPAPRSWSARGADFRVICPGYFRRSAFRVVSGRDFSAVDVRDGDQVVIISRARGIASGAARIRSASASNSADLRATIHGTRLSASSTTCGISGWTSEARRKCIGPTTRRPGR